MQDTDQGKNEFGVMDLIGQMGPFDIKAILGDLSAYKARITDLESELAAEKAHVKELQSIIRQIKHGLDE